MVKVLGNFVQLTVIMSPTSKKLMRGILVSGCECLRLSVRPSVCSSRTVHARVSKFHIWIPHGKIVYTLFSSPEPKAHKVSL